MKLNVLTVFNRRTWPELFSQRDELDKIGNPYIEQTSDSITLDLGDIPFIPDPASGADCFKVDPVWIKEKILPLKLNGDGDKYDYIRLHITSERWYGKRINGYTYRRSDTGFDTTIMVTHSYEGETLDGVVAPDKPNYRKPFLERGQHEEGHVMCDLRNLPDRTHEIENRGNLWKGEWFEYLGVPGPNNVDNIAYIKKLISQLFLLVAELTKKRDELIQSQTKLQSFCLAIQEYEGWRPGSRSFRNNNPGNIRYVGQRLAIGKDAQGFAIFKTYEDGFSQLKTTITRAAQGLSSIYKPEMSITDFFRVYAPASDNNVPDLYAGFVARKVGVPIYTKIKELI